MKNGRPCKGLEEAVYCSKGGKGWGGGGGGGGGGTVRFPPINRWFV